mgnify:CR=1 FL=1
MIVKLASWTEGKQLPGRGARLREQDGVGAADVDARVAERGGDELAREGARVAELAEARAGAADRVL